MATTEELVEKLKASELYQKERFNFSDFEEGKLSIHSKH